MVKIELQTVSPSSLSANNSTSEISLAEDEEENGEEKYDFTSKHMLQNSYSIIPNFSVSVCVFPGMNAGNYNICRLDYTYNFICPQMTFRRPQNWIARLRQSI